jgi:hypothetical protein
MRKHVRLIARATAAFLDQKGRPWDEKIARLSAGPY